MKDDTLRWTVLALSIYLIISNIDPTPKKLNAVSQISKDRLFWNLWRLAFQIILPYLLQPPTYTNVYNYRKSDLLDKTITNSPDLINIKELECSFHEDNPKKSSIAEFWDLNFEINFNNQVHFFVKYQFQIWKERINCWIERKIFRIIKLKE